MQDRKNLGILDQTLIEELRALDISLSQDLVCGRTPPVSLWERRAQILTVRAQIARLCA
jgi:hypothetical protein